MVEPTFKVGDYAIPAAVDGHKVNLFTRIGYAFKALRGDFMMVNAIDVSHLKSDGYMEGTLRVYLSKREVRRYFEHVEEPPSVLR